MKARGDRFEESCEAEGKIGVGEAGWKARARKRRARRLRARLLSFRMLFTGCRNPKPQPCTPKPYTPPQARYYQEKMGAPPQPPKPQPYPHPPPHTHRRVLPGDDGGAPRRPRNPPPAPGARHRGHRAALHRGAAVGDGLLLRRRGVMELVGLPFMFCPYFVRKRGSGQRGPPARRAAPNPAAGRGAAGVTAPPPCGEAYGRCRRCKEPAAKCLNPSAPRRYYPYHYAPFASDLVEIAPWTSPFTRGAPSRFNQLMVVLPARSAHCLPEAYRRAGPGARGVWTVCRGARVPAPALALHREGCGRSGGARGPQLAAPRPHLASTSATPAPI